MVFNLRETNAYVVKQFTDSMFHGFGISCIQCEKKYNRYVLGVTDNGAYFLYDALRYAVRWCCRIKKRDGKNTRLTGCSFLSHDHSKFCTISSDNCLRIYESKTSERPLRQLDLGHRAHSCDFNTKASLLGIGLDDGKIRLINPKEEVNLNQLETRFRDAVKCVEWDKTHDNLITVGDNAGRVFLYDIRNQDRPYHFGFSRVDVEDEDNAGSGETEPVIGMTFAKSGNLFVTLNGNGDMREWDINTGLATLRTYRIEVNNRKQRTIGLCWMNDNTLLVPSKSAVVDVYTDKHMFGHLKDVTCVIECADGFASAGEDSFLCIWKKNDEAVFEKDVSDWSNEDY